MKILLVFDGKVPVHLYGGTERVLWAMAKELFRRGHEITFLVKEKSYCDFAKVIYYNEKLPIGTQISNDYDLVHFFYRPSNLEGLKIPYLITIHGNSNDINEFDLNTVFVSKNHAQRYNSNSYVHNGLDWEEYGQPELSRKRNYFHFLGNAAWRLKNVKGAINIIKSIPNEKLKVLGGVRFNIQRGIRFTFSSQISFSGMVGGEIKNNLLNGSKGLIFPVRWNEPFGLAIIESMYFGCPVFGTPYGSLPELVTPEFGFLSNNKNELKNAILNSNNFDAFKCHEYARDVFNIKIMTDNYMKKYELVLNNKKLNSLAPKLIELQNEKFLPWN